MHQSRWGVTCPLHAAGQNTGAQGQGSAAQASGAEVVFGLDLPLHTRQAPGAVLAGAEVTSVWDLPAYEVGQAPDPQAPSANDFDTMLHMRGPHIGLRPACANPTACVPFLERRANA